MSSFLPTATFPDCITTPTRPIRSMSAATSFWSTTTVALVVPMVTMTNMAMTPATRMIPIAVIRAMGMFTTIPPATSPPAIVPAAVIGTTAPVIGTPVTVIGTGGGIVIAIGKAIPMMRVVG